MAPDPPRPAEWKEDEGVKNEKGTKKREECGIVNVYTFVNSTSPSKPTIIIASMHVLIKYPEHIHMCCSHNAEHVVDPAVTLGKSREFLV